MSVTSPFLRLHHSGGQYEEVLRKESSIQCSCHNLTKEKAKGGGLTDNGSQLGLGSYLGTGKQKVLLSKAKDLKTIGLRQCLCSLRGEKALQ